MVDPFVSVFGSPRATRQVPHWFAAASSDLTSRTKQSALLVGLDRGYLNDRMPSQELVKRALAGERAAIEALVVELSPVVQARVAAALYRCGHSSRQELEDLTQEILMDLFTGEGRVLSSWDPERGLSLASFVGLVAQRQVYSRLRSRRRSPFTQRPTDPSAIDASDLAALYRCGHSSRQELEDLTQEILMDLFTGEGRVLSSWDPERGLSLASFVGLVAQRQVYSRLRSRRRSPFTQRPTDPSAIDA